MSMNYKIKHILFILPLFLISSCGNGNTSSSVNSNLSSNLFPSYQKMEVDDKALLSTLYNNYGTPILNSIGKQKLLVIPIVIKGYEDNAKDDVLEKLNKAFFGKSEEVEYESVASFYHKSSYEKLNIEGKVAKWFNPNVTPEELKNHASSSYDDGGLFWLLDKALTWYQSQYNDLSDFDSNKDGYIDSIYMIYSAPNYHNDSKLSSFYWAFTYSHMENKENNNKDKLKAMRYSWSSFDALYQGYGNDKIDSHTYIHETGHLLGLSDYYDTGSSNVSPMGLVDMMDYDIGDHSMYSKFSLGWVKPYLIDHEGTIILNSAEKTGDFLIFKTDNMNNTPFDEYIMMEFITPTGLNQKDYLEGYKKYWNDSPIKGFETPGVRITYINSRAVGNDNKFKDNIDEMIGIKFSNTPRGNVEGFLSSEGQFFLLSTLIPKDCKYGNNGLSGASFKANSSHLFTKGDTFDLTHDSQYRDMTFHRTNKYDKDGAGFFKYIVTIDDMNENRVKISFKTY